MKTTIFVVLWVIFSAYSLWRIISLMAVSGKVSGDGRFMTILSMTPLSYLIAPCIALAEACFFADSQVEKLKSSPAYIQWSIERKIRKRRRGPLVRIVEHLHNKRKGRVHEKNLPKG